MKIPRAVSWSIAGAVLLPAVHAALSAPLPDFLPDMMRSAGVCRAGAPCPVNEANLKQLGLKAAQTEQWKPVPPKVAANANTVAPPSDALVLFDGQDLAQWVGAKDRLPARWPVRDGVLTVDKAAGGIETKRHFRDFQLHLEWLVPENISGEGQLRGNSGLFLAVTGPNDQGYEIQILDSWNNPTYANGQAASIYKQAAPLVNASLPPGRWQSYDVIWKAPRFNPNGSLREPAYVTLFHNGVLVQDHVRLAGETVFVGKPPYRAYDRAPIGLQSHFDPSAPLSFRNIWVRELNEGRR